MAKSPKFYEFKDICKKINKLRIDSAHYTSNDKQGELEADLDMLKNIFENKLFFRFLADN